MSAKQQERHDRSPTRRLRTHRPPPARRGPALRARARGTSQQSGLDEQQERLIAVLGRAHGETVSYDELRDAGIEYPATVVSELELSGWPLERSFGASGARRLGVRLDPGEIAEEEASESGNEQLPPLLARRGAGVPLGARIASAASALAERGRLTGASLIASARRRRPTAGRTTPTRASWAPRHRARMRWLAPALLLLVAAGVAALILGSSGTTSSHSNTASHPRRHSHRRGTAAHVRPARAEHRRSAAATSQTSASSPPASSAPLSTGASTSVSQASAASLEARGHALLTAGQLQAAILMLRHAVTATGENPSACLVPAGEACLTYAYALFDLGRALRLDHQPAAAATILEQRQRIANQQATVMAELALARQEASGSAAGTPASR